MREKMAKYLARKEVPLEMRIGTLIREGLSPHDFLSFGEKLIAEASPDEQVRCAKHLDHLAQLMKGRQTFLQAGH